METIHVDDIDLEITFRTRNYKYAPMATLCFLGTYEIGAVRINAFKANGAPNSENYVVVSDVTHISRKCESIEIGKKLLIADAKAFVHNITRKAKEAQVHNES